MARKKRSDAGVPRTRRAAAAPAGGLARARNLGARVADTVARGATRAATALRGTPIVTPAPRGGAIIRRPSSALTPSVDPNERSSALRVPGRRRRRAAPRPQNAGGRSPGRRENAIRNLANRGATPGERAAAAAAASRLGINL